jgi:glycolate oxidase FAD binding subunit
VIGLKLVHADGTESKSGGKVVKNVAGYDMNKLYVGSYGTLAIITELTFKLRPLADRSSTIVITSNDCRHLFQLAKQVLAADLRPASVILTRRLFATGASNGPDDALLIRFIDSEAAVEHQVDRVIQTIGENANAVLLSENEADAIWAQVADFEPRAVQVRLSVPLSAVSAEFENACLADSGCVAAADIGTGIIRLAFDVNDGSAVDQVRRLRASATAANGTLVIERASAGVRGEADAWGDVGSAAELMRSIKERFDPQALLNPGKFVLGL